MARPKSERRSAELAADIARLEEERKRLVQSEDQRRGALIRDLLAQAKGDEFRTFLSPHILPRDAFLFGLDKPSPKTKPSRDRATTTESSGASARRNAETASAD
ncbi:MAG TPA: hypothetical protein VGM50_02340 [Gemmatimonadaceae bacterium]|jgi:hypothetical protein